MTSRKGKLVELLYEQKTHIVEQKSIQTKKKNDQRQPGKQISRTGFIESGKADDTTHVHTYMKNNNYLKRNTAGQYIQKKLIIFIIINISTCRSKMIDKKKNNLSE